MRTRQLPLQPLLALFVLSGAAGLVYEVVWARQLVLVFGNTSQAVSTILTGFFSGLAVGGWLGGRLADRVARPLRMYGLLELMVVMVVILTPLSFRLLGSIYRGVYPDLETSPLGLALVRFALSIGALAPATVLMGATLPTLARFLGRGGDGLAQAFRRLYIANTVGAVVGTLLAGLILIEVLGLAGALLVGAACSAAAGLIALVLDRQADATASGDVPGAASSAAETTSAVAAPSTAEAPTPAKDRRRLAMLLAFLSGLTSLGYQVTWNRLLAAGTGNSTYVFTVILALFLVGIVIGAGMLGGVRLKVRSVVVLIGGAQLATALLATAGALLIASPTGPYFGVSPAFPLALLRFAAQVTLVVLPATIAMGMTFPATAALLGDRYGSEGAASGRLLAFNTAGSLVATFALPFFVIPILGSPATLAALVLTNLVIGVVLLVSSRELDARQRRRALVTAVAGVTAVAVATVSGRAFGNPTIAMIQAKEGGQVYAATEDDIAGVVAGQAEGWPQIWVGGTSMTIVTVDTKFMPLLPLALRPDASDGLVIAFGMGTAFRTSLNAGVSTDVVELVPSVPRMFHWYYDDAAAVLANAKGRVIVADGRNHVELTDRTYDFVVVDPPPPIESSGVSVISSLEFYQSAKARLKAGGVMVQWVPFGQTLDEFLAHVRTYLQVFPNVRVIQGPGGYGYYMLGSDGSVDLTATALAAVLNRPGVLEDVNAAPDADGKTATGWADALVALNWASGDELRAAVGNGPLITDDHPLPEYFLLRRLGNLNAPMMDPERLNALLR